MSNTAATVLHDLIGGTITSIIVDYRVTFQISLKSREWATLTLSTPFSVGGEEHSHLVDPEDATTYEAIWAVQRHAIVGAYVTKNGTIHIEFTDGVEICSHPNPRYEAWELTMGARTVLSSPGGEVITWGDGSARRRVS